MPRPCKAESSVQFRVRAFAGRDFDKCYMKWETTAQWGLHTNFCRKALEKGCAGFLRSGGLFMPKFKVRIPKTEGSELQEDETEIEHDTEDGAACDTAALYSSLNNTLYTGPVAVNGKIIHVYPIIVWRTMDKQMDELLQAGEILDTAAQAPSSMH